MRKPLHVNQLLSVWGAPSHRLSKYKGIAENKPTKLAGTRDDLIKEELALP